MLVLNIFPLSRIYVRFKRILLTLTCYMRKFYKHSFTLLLYIRATLTSYMRKFYKHSFTLLLYRRATSSTSEQPQKEERDHGAMWAQFASVS